MAAVPPSYENSRQRFRGSLVAVKTRWPAAELDAHILSYENDLSIDSISAPAIKAKEKLFVITTGQHGIEGYIGSAMLHLFADEFLPGFDPDTCGILMVHAVNPWGMLHRKRGNPKNVDLNRNFIEGDFGALSACNPDYLILSPVLNPKGPIRGLLGARVNFIFQTGRTLLQFGDKRTREATLMGQFTDPEGVYFGGMALQEETRFMMDLYRKHFRGYDKVIHLDMHTGYGPRYQMTVVNSPFEKMDTAETRLKYGLGRVAAANPDEFYTMHGDMITWEYGLVQREYPGMHFFGGAFEFGTYGDSLLSSIRSWRITIFKNRANLYGAAPAAQKWVDREYFELYLPSETGWFEKAQDDARQAFYGVLASEGFIRPVD